MKAILGLLRDMPRRYRRHRRRLSTERVLNGLPPSLMRDIGWPGRDRIELD